MLERFTRERQRASKSSAFNLEDEDVLTHFGQSLSKLDDFDNVGLGLEEDEDEAGMSHFCGKFCIINVACLGQIDRDTVQTSHFGGFEEDEEGDDDDEVRCIEFGSYPAHSFIRAIACSKKVEGRDYGGSHCEEQSS